MRRYSFYLIIAFITFAFSSLIVFNLYRAKPEKNEFETEIPLSVKTPTAAPVGIGFGTGKREAQPSNESENAANYKLTCRRKDLQPVWNELIKEKEFKERAGNFYVNADCTELFKVKKIDLNGDGQKEFIFWGNNFMCGATGNCALWIYEKRKNIYRLLLQTSAYHDGAQEWLEIKKDKTNNYRNILIKAHFTAAETTHYLYKFDGRRYAETGCWFEIYSQNNKKPSIKTCKQRLKELEN